MTNHPDHPILVLIRGLPGSGKTYLAKRLAKAIGDDKVVMLDPDAIDYNSREYKDHVKAQTAEGVDPKLHPYRFSRSQADKGMADKKIILWNQPFTNLEMFNKITDRFAEEAKAQKTELPILVVEVEVDQSVAKQRIDDRKQQGGHGPSDETFDRFVNDYKSFAEQGYNTVTVNGGGDVEDSVQKILNAVNNLV